VPNYTQMFTRTQTDYSYGLRGKSVQIGYACDGLPPNGTRFSCAASIDRKAVEPNLDFKIALISLDAKRRQLQAPVGWLRRPSVELACQDLLACVRASTRWQSKAYQSATRLPETTPAPDDLRGHHHQMHRVSVTACKLAATQRLALQLRRND
jgi:hypothetical protein